MNKSKITWCDYTWNPMTGCSMGCPYCYARKVTERFPAAFPGGFKPTFHSERLKEPLKLRAPSVIFVCSMGELFDPAITDMEIKRVFDAMFKARKHTFVVLTKCYRRAIEVALSQWAGFCTNIWWGFSVTDVAQASDARGLFASLPPERRFYSFEPLFDAEAARICLGLGAPRPKMAIFGAKTPGPALHETMPDELYELLKDCYRSGMLVHYKHGNTNPVLRDRYGCRMVLDDKFPLYIQLEEKGGKR
jgi:protein gp37